MRTSGESLDSEIWVADGTGRGRQRLIRIRHAAAERVLPPPATAPPDMERLHRIAERSGMVILGPPGPPPGT